MSIFVSFHFIPCQHFSLSSAGHLRRAFLWPSAMEIDDRHGTSDLDIQHAKWPLPQSVSKHRHRQAERQSLLWLDSGSLCFCLCHNGKDSDEDISKGRRDNCGWSFSTDTLEYFNIIFYFTICKGYMHSNYGDLSQLEETSPLCSLASSKKLR